MTKPTTVPCPTCQKPVVWSDANPHRPFCCKRCQLIDLGAWAAEEHSIAGPSAAETMFSEDWDKLH